MRPAAFLDRDGVVCEYVDSLHRLEDFKLRTDVGKAIRHLNEAGYWVFIITNQPMIANGLLTHESLKTIHERMEDDLRKKGAHLDAIQYCPHSPHGKVAPWNVECLCRKPKPGMIEKILADFPVDLERSFLAGDTWRDIECAKSMGLFSYGVCGGAGFPYETSSPHASSKADVTVHSLWEAVQHQLKIGVY